jgi:hypothetical protein
MKSPITGTQMKLEVEKRIIDNIEFDFWFYRCDSGEKFTTTDIDTINVYNYNLAKNK